MLQLPKHMPPTPTTIPSPQTANFCIPIMIRMQQPATYHGKFDKARILHAILNALQNAHPDCTIRPKIQILQTNPNTTVPIINKILTTTNDIPINEEITNYIEIPPTTTPGNFSARILLNSMIDLHVLKRNRDLIEWLKQENITIDRNPLEECLKPHQIGFFTHFAVRTDQINMYEQRVIQQTSTHCPPFFLQVKHLKARHATTKVWNVYGDPKDTDLIIKELKSAYNSQTLRQFYSWKEYQSLHHTQQITVVHTNNQFTTDFRSLLIPGFLNDDTITPLPMWEDDNPIRPSTNTNGELTGEWEFTHPADDTIMIEEDITDRFRGSINLTTINISDFIQQYFISGDTTPIFAHVYEPIQGTREVLVGHKHVPEALDLIKNIHSELCRHMSHDTIHRTFPTPDELLSVTNSTDPWQPFDIQSSIPATNYNDSSPKRNIRQKRFRHKHQDNKTQHNSSYLEIAAKYTKTNTEHGTNHHLTQNTPTSNTPISATIDNNDTRSNNILQIVSTLQTNIKSLQTSIASMEEKLELSTTNNSNDIHTAELRCTNRINELHITTTNAINDISASFIDQMALHQQNSNSILLKLLETREESLIIISKIYSFRGLLLKRYAVVLAAIGLIFV
jgi:hypothetical protein